MAGRGRGRRPQQQEGGQGPPQNGGGGRGYAQVGGGGQGRPPPAGNAWGPALGAPARAPQQHQQPPRQPPPVQQQHRQPPAQANLDAQMGQMNLGGAQGAVARQAAGADGPVGRGAMRGRRPIGGEQILRTRPTTLATKQGKGGKPLQMMANYFKIETVPDWALHQYRVDIAPEEDRTGARRFLLKAHKELLGGYIFDGTVLYTTTRITSPQNPVLTLTSANGDDSQIFTITIKEVGEVQKGDYAYVQVYNLLLRTCISGLDLQLVGRDYYDARAKVEVPQYRLELWPGYKTSIRQHERDILMCVEITHKVMRMETVLDLLAECYSKGGNFQANFVKEVVGCIVLTKYNNKTYRIDDVDFNMHPSDTFDFRGEKISYSEYMRRKYQIEIRDPRQPMLISRAKARDVRAGMSEVINLIPEVCHCTGLTDGMRSNMQLMRALAVHTRVAPDTRIQKLQHFNKRLQQNEQAMTQMRKFDMRLAPDLVKFTSRIVDEEKILLGGGRTGAPGPQVDWMRDLRSSSMLLSRELSSWVIVVPNRERGVAMKFAGLLRKAAAGMRFPLAEPRIVEVQRDGSGDYVNALSQILDSSAPQLIMCAVPNNRGDRYAAIKKKCCVDRAVPTQVVTTRNIGDDRKNMSIATKVAIQMNCKIGGAPWGVDIPLPGLMVVGFDVCHDTGSRDKSFGAMVASLDKPMSRYFSAVTAHTNGEELSNNFSLNIVKAVKKYSEHNGALPARILIYRDGVGEGQIPFVASMELDSIKSRLVALYGKDVPLTFVIVTKRINTRLFTGNGQNPPPGSVVDDVVTDPEKYDFFLVSQSVREGTVSPTSYNVIHDGMNLPAERMQRLTYKLCHLYFNWSGTVRVPAPCQYAHKLAFLVGQSLHREPNQNLEDLLYFL